MQDQCEMACVGDKATLRVLSFNVLAPSMRICSPLNRVQWQDRHNKICQMLLREPPDVACIQEFDFSPRTPGFRELYESSLGRHYELFSLQRTGRKPEGLAMLFRRDSWQSIHVQDHRLEPGYCDRVAQLATLRHASGLPMVVANTHLTVAHADNDHDIPSARPEQMKQVLDLVEASKGSVALICADVNSDHLEASPPASLYNYSAADVSRPVTMAFDRGLRSALHTVGAAAGLSPGDAARPISHTSSYSQDGCCDYVFFRPDERLRPREAFLYPQSLPARTSWDPDHGWGSEDFQTLSDHRPLVVDFDLGTG